MLNKATRRDKEKTFQEILLEELEKQLKKGTKDNDD